MTGRERILTTLRHEEPDRVPFDLGSRSSAIEIEPYRELTKYLGIGGMQENRDCFLRAHARMSEDICEKLGVDTRWVRSFPDSVWSSREGEELFTDPWNVPWVRKPETHYYEIGGSPLADLRLESLKDYSFPPLTEEKEIDKMRGEALSHYNNHYFVGNDFIGAGPFERSWYLRGYASVLLETAVYEGEFRDYLEAVTEHQIEYYRRILTRMDGVCQAVWITDDVAGQEGMIISPDFYRRIIKPLPKRLIAVIKEFGVEVVFHSCGAVGEVLPDFLEMGVKILHPIQIDAKRMDRKSLKSQYGNDIVFWGGGLDVEVLRRGTEEQIADQVKEAVDLLAPGGGFVFTPTHCIQPGTPPKNIMAMVDALHKYGVY